MRCPNKHDQIELHSQAQSVRHRSSALAAASATTQSSPPAERSRTCRWPGTLCIAPTPSKCAQVRTAVLQTSKHSAASAHCNRIAEDFAACRSHNQQRVVRHNRRSSGSQTAFRGCGRHWLSLPPRADRPHSAYKENSPQFFFGIQPEPGVRRWAWHRGLGPAFQSSTPTPTGDRCAMRLYSRAHSDYVRASQCLERSGSRSPR